MLFCLRFSELRVFCIVFICSMKSESIGVDNLLDDGYVPSSIERKRSLLMYFFVWIIFSLTSVSVSIYEMYHLRQSVGWWVLLFLTLICSLPFLFLPYLRTIPVILFCLYLLFWLIFAKQAREWRYCVLEDTVLFPVFHWLWWRVLSIFETKFEITDE